MEERDCRRHSLEHMVRSSVSLFLDPYMRARLSKVLTDMGIAQVGVVAQVVVVGPLHPRAPAMSRVTRIVGETLHIPI